MSFHDSYPCYFQSHPSRTELSRKQANSGLTFLSSMSLMLRIILFFVNILYGILYVFNFLLLLF